MLSRLGYVQAGHVAPFLFACNKIEFSSDEALIFLYFESYLSLNLKES